jgi:hypothetical protein
LGVGVKASAGVGDARAEVTLGTGVSSSLIRVAMRGVASPAPWSPAALPIRFRLMAGMAMNTGSAL